MYRIADIQPTVFFIEEQGDLLQAVDLVIENTGKRAEVTINAAAGEGKKHTNTQTVAKGKQTYRVYVPDLRKPATMKFALSVKGKVKDKRKIDWEPQRHWEVYMVPISHHDFGYTHTLDQSLERFDGFYDQILDYCEQTDHWPEDSKYRYTCEAAWSIRHFIKNRPQPVIDKLARYMREGRIEVPALLGNQCTSLCSHEELVRLMYPSFELNRTLGAPINVAAVVDIPGFTWGLASTIAGAGLKYFYAGLPEWAENETHQFWDADTMLPYGRPDAFRWEGPDGQSVLMYYQPSYGCWSPDSCEEAEQALPGKLRALEEAGCRFSVLRHGCYWCWDNEPPDIMASRVAREWNNRWAYPKFIVATNTMFFEALEKQCSDVRTVRGELTDTDNPVGVTSTAKETGLNRVTHDRLHAAEKFATIASVVSDAPCPTEKLADAYEHLVLFDEHTWGMARPIEVAQDWNWSDKSRCAYRAAGLTDSLLSESTDAIARMVNVKGSDPYITVFNALAVKRTDVVRVTSFDVEGAFDLVDETTGKPVPYQVVEVTDPLAPVPYAAQRYAMGQRSSNELLDLVFVAEDVPSLGYKTYRLARKKKTRNPRGSLRVGETSLQNRFYKITLDPRTGAVDSIYDKELKREMVDPDAPHKLNEFIVREAKTGKEQRKKKATIRKGQSGPVYSSLVVSGAGAGCPQLTQEIILYDQVKRIDIANRFLKDTTPFQQLYFAFPFKVDEPDVRFEGPNSVIEPVVDQFPGSNTHYYAVQHWADVSDGDVGVTISPVESHLLMFGGLWPFHVAQIHHTVTPPDFTHPMIEPGDLKKGHVYSYVLNNNFHTNFSAVQTGDMLFRYSITTHQGGWKAGRPRDFGWSTGNPLIPVLVKDEDGAHGVLPVSNSFGRVSKRNVMLLTLKRAEDGNGFIVRLAETEGKDCDVTVTLPLLPVRHAYSTNLVEEDEGALPVKKNSVTTPIKGHGLATIRVIQTTRRK